MTIARRFRQACGLLATLLALQAAQAHPLALDLQAGGFAQPCTSCGSTGTTYGWSFSVADSVEVTGLAAWDSDGDGLGGAVQVGLFDAAGTLLLSAAVDDGTGTPLPSAGGAGAWLSVRVAPLRLQAGNYLLGQVFTDFMPTAQLGAAYTLDPRIVLTGGVVSALSDTGLAAPLDALPDPIFGPNLLLAPEPGSLAVVALALALLVAGRRSRATVHASPDPRRVPCSV